MQEEIDKAYDIGYKEGAEAVINRVSKFEVIGNIHENNNLLEELK